MDNKYTKVKGIEAVRDNRSNAILFSKGSNKRRKFVEQMKKTQQENNILRSRIDKLENLIEILIENKK